MLPLHKACIEQLTGMRTPAVSTEDNFRRLTGFALSHSHEGVWRRVLLPETNPAENVSSENDAHPDFGSTASARQVPVNADPEIPAYLVNQDDSVEDLQQVRRVVLKHFHSREKEVEEEEGMRGEAGLTPGGMVASSGELGTRTQRNHDSRDPDSVSGYLSCIEKDSVWKENTFEEHSEDTTITIPAQSASASG